MTLKDISLRIIKPVFRNYYRTRVAKYLADLCPDKGKVLDVGCNDGKIALMINQQKPGLVVHGLDIQDNNGCLISKDLYDGHTMPYKDNAFDIVLAVDVLHHTTDILSVLQEMARVSKTYILIKDVVVYSKLTYNLMCVVDYLSNFRYGIKCTYNFPNRDEWNNYFCKSNLAIIKQPDNLNYGFGINDRYNLTIMSKKTE